MTPSFFRRRRPRRHRRRRRRRSRRRPRCPLPLTKQARRKRRDRDKTASRLTSSRLGASHRDAIEIVSATSVKRFKCYSHRLPLLPRSDVPSIVVVVVRALAARIRHARSSRSFRAARIGCRESPLSSSGFFGGGLLVVPSYVTSSRLSRQRALPFFPAKRQPSP